MRRGRSHGRGWRSAAARGLTALLPLALPWSGAEATAAQRPDAAPLRITEGRFTILAWPHDAHLARSLIAGARAQDTFPGLPRSSSPVLIAIAPDRDRFRQWIGAAVPEWGTAAAFPLQSRIVLQGSRAGSDAGDPRVVLRHELAHVALYEALHGRAPRWLDEGYASWAAGEWGRDEMLATNLALVLRGVPSLARLDSALTGGNTEAGAAYALAHRAVAELAALDQQRGLSLFLRYFAEGGELDRAVRDAYGLTLEQFEERWQSRTRRRYGALAVFADLTVFGLVVLGIVVPLYVSRRRRDRRRLASMRAHEDAVERAERATAIEALIRSLPRPPGAPPPARGGEGHDEG